MSFWRQLTHGLRGFMRRKARDREVADEVEQYFEEAAAAWRARGVTAAEANRGAGAGALLRMGKCGRGFLRRSPVCRTPTAQAPNIRCDCRDDACVGHRCE